MATSDRDVNIHLKLFDDFSSSAQRIQTNINNIGESLERTGRQVQQFGTKLAVLGGAITGGFLVSMKAVEDASPRVNRAMTELGNVFRNLQLSIAEAVVPAVERMTDVLAAMVDAWNELSPSTREAITQFAFLSGIALLAAGSFLKFSGILISIVGKIATLVSWITKKNLVILAVVVALEQMIQHWDKVRQYVLPVVKALQIVGDATAIAYLELGRAVLWMIDAALKPFIAMVVRLIPILEATKVISKETADAWRDSLAGISDNFQAAREKMGDQVDILKKDMKDAATDTGQTWSKTVDDVATKTQQVVRKTIDAIEDFVSGATERIGRTTSKAKEQIFNWASFTKQTVQRLADSMSSSLGNFFYNTLRGQVNAGKQFFIDFGNSVLQILTQALAKLVLFYTVGKALQTTLGFNPFQFHSGGVVRKAHSGTYAQDEVPIIAQEGEGVLSRQGMTMLGKSNLKRLNRGEEMEGGAGGKNPPVVVIQAWDTQDIMRNSKTIERIIADSMRRNSGLRGVMKQYG